MDPILGGTCQYTVSADPGYGRRRQHEERSNPSFNGEAATHGRGNKTQRKPGKYYVVCKLPNSIYLIT